MSPVEEIKSRLDLVEFIQNYVRLHKSGINYKALCPFHTEKTPSFFVSPSRQIWHCFGGCGKGGDIFKFVMEIEGLDFPEALKLLASRAGIILKREDPALRSERNRLYEINEEAANMFERSLVQNSAAKAYLAGRGLHEKTIKDFRIGFAPRSWDYLLSHLARTFSRQEIEKSGLVVVSEDRSSVYDRFRSRIMFPITDANGRVVGFGGRIFEQEAGSSKQEAAPAEAKYINTPQTPVYDKSRVVYGFDRAKQEIRQRDRVVVVEGYMDCVMSHQSGVKNTVAVSGTALTPEQLKVLRRLTSCVALSFDTDAAGDSATHRSLAAAARFEFERLVVKIPSGKDPADAVLENPALWQAAVDDAKPVLDFYFAKTFSDFNPRDAEGKKQITSVILPLIVELPDRIEQAHWIGEFAKRLGVPEEAVRQELNRRAAGWKDEPDSSRVPPPTAISRERMTRRDLLEERFLALLLLQKGLAIADMNLLHISFRDAAHRQIFEWLLTHPDSVGELPENVASAVQTLTFKSEALADMLKDVAAEFALSAREFERECIRERLMVLRDEIARKEREGNLLAVGELLHDAHVLSDRIRELQQ